jgi:hypothetical protein
MFSLQQNWRTRGWNKFCPEAPGRCGERQIMHTHVSKGKNDKIKKKKITITFFSQGKGCRQWPIGAIV